jgi:hypothetical protein
MSADEKKYGPSDIDLLMKRIGAKRWDPIPPDQYLWMMGEDQTSPDVRWQGWVLAHTIAWPNRSPYAVNKEGQEQHIEHAAADLGWEIHNARTYCRRGAERGFTRMGTEAEGSRRIYLCGTVRQIKPAVPDAAKAAGVWPNPYPAYICKQINELPETDRAILKAEDERLQQIQGAIHAEMLAAERIVFDQQHDSLFQRFRIDQIRQIHKSSMEPAELAARHSRISLIVPAVEKAIEGFGQTPLGFVQTPENGLAKVSKDSGQTASPRATLSGLEPQEKPELSGVRANLVGPQSAPEAQHHNEGLMHDQDHTPPTANSRKAAAGTPPKKAPAGDASDEKLKAYLATHRPADHAQAEILYAGIPELQKRWPAAPFSTPRFSAMGKGDQALTKQILAALEGDDASEFLQSVERRCEKGRVESVGLFVELAKAFHRAAPERAKRKAEWDKEEARQAAFTEAARRREEAEYNLLREHPEKCPFCQGSGVRDIENDRGGKWKGPCVCPAGEQAAVKTA